MRSLGVPYPEGYEDQAVDDLNAQAQEVYEAIIEQDPEIKKARPDMELIALIAYLERLGSDINKQTDETDTDQTENTATEKEDAEVLMEEPQNDSTTTEVSDTLNTQE